MWIINPDLPVARIRDVEEMALPEANLAAVQRIEAWLESSLEAHRSVGAETVLSTPKYRRPVELAKRPRLEYDNSAANPRLIAEKVDDEISLDEDGPENVLRAIGYAAGGS